MGGESLLAWQEITMDTTHLAHWKIKISASEVGYNVINIWPASSERKRLSHADDIHCKNIAGVFCVNRPNRYGSPQKVVNTTQFFSGAPGNQGRETTQC